jgi:serine protease Do
MRKAVVAALGVTALVAAVLAVRPSHAQTTWDVLTLVGAGSTIGASVADLSADEAVKHKVESGVRIASVQEGTPAARAGLRAGDLVLEFDGERVRSVTQFVRVVRETPPGRAVRATILRDGSRQTLNVTPEMGRATFGKGAGTALRVQPNTVAPAPFDQFVWTGSQQQLGVSVIALDDQLASYFGVKQGVLVTSVSAGTPAATSGLRAGDVITSVAGQPVQQPAQVADAVRAAPAGSGIELRIMRDKKEVTLKATMPERQNRPRVNEGRVTL